VAASCGGTAHSPADTRVNDTVPSTATVTAISDAAVQVVANGCSQAETHGAGMMVAQGRVATVAHVVAGAKTVEVRAPHGVGDATVVYIDPVLDVALLKVDPALASPISIGSASPGDHGDVVVYREDAPVTLPVEVQRLVNIRTADIYGQGEHIRPGYELTLDIRAGDSGAVVVIDHHAVALVWATSRQAAARAWAMRTSLLEDHLGLDEPVATGECA
jgi:S1-C subfamily serine protease